MEQKHRAKGRLDQRGMTLVEVLIATLVMAVAIMSCLSMVSQEWALVQRTQEQIYVTRILESKMEEIRDLAFDDLLTLGEETTFNVSPFLTVTGEDVGADTEDPDFERQLRSLEGRLYLTLVEADLLKAEIEIVWTPVRGTAASTMRTMTYIARNGVGQR